MIYHENIYHDLKKTCAIKIIHVFIFFYFITKLIYFLFVHDHMLPKAGQLFFKPATL